MADLKVSDRIERELIAVADIMRAPCEFTLAALRGDVATRCDSSVGRVTLARLSWLDSSS